MGGGGNFPEVPDWRIYKVGPHTPGLVMKSGGLTEDSSRWQTGLFSSGGCCQEDSSLDWGLQLSQQEFITILSLRMITDIINKDFDSNSGESSQEHDSFI